MLLAIGALLTAAIVVALCLKEREPAYQGKTLTQWLNIYQGFIYGRGQQSDAKAAADAIRNIGTNALPVLLKWTADETPNWRRKLGHFAHFNRAGQVRRFAHWSVYHLLLNEDHRAEAAVLGFQALGDIAIPAIPELSRLMNKGNSSSGSRHAIEALMMIGGNGLVPLVNTVTNHAAAVSVRCQAAFTLGYVFAGLAETNAPSQIHALARSVEDTNNPTNLRYAVIVALGQMGEVARDAVPSLTRALSDPETELRMAATNAISQLSPGSVDNAQSAPAQ